MRLTLFAAAFAASAAMASAAQSATVSDGIGYTIGDDGTSLVTIANLAMPGATSSVALTSGGASITLSALAFRPQTGQLYGYSDANDTVYLVDPRTGASAVVVAASGGPNAAGAPIRTTTATLGFDFNNFIDAARIVTTNDENLVFFPPSDSPNLGDTPRTEVSVNRFTDLFFSAGDVNEGDDPSVFANAYTNAVPAPSSTLQYVLDSGNDVIGTLGNNAGNIDTVGALTLNGAALDFSDIGGFDILSLADGDNLGIALLEVGGVLGLYSFAVAASSDALVNGDVAVTFLGALGAGFTGLAVAPTAAIPVPAALPLFLGGLGALGWARRRSARRNA